MAIDHEQIAEEVKAQFACKHEHTEVRRKMDKAGRILILRQCTRCGRQHGNYLSPREHDVKSLPEWDAALENRYSATCGDTMRARFEQAKAQERNAFLKRHDAYLKSEVWLKLRKKILDRARYICEGCGEAPATQVHHLSYARWGGNELLIDLLAVCDACHEKLHPKNKHFVDVLIESRNLPENNRGPFFDLDPS